MTPELLDEGERLWAASKAADGVIISSAKGGCYTDDQRANAWGAIEAFDDWHNIHTPALIAGCRERDQAVECLAQTDREFVMVLKERDALKAELIDRTYADGLLQSETAGEDVLRESRELRELMAERYTLTRTVRWYAEVGNAWMHQAKLERERGDLVRAEVARLKGEVEVLTKTQVLHYCDDCPADNGKCL